MLSRMVKKIVSAKRNPKKQKKYTKVLRKSVSLHAGLLKELNF
jgi:hypothetical protein